MPGIHLALLRDQYAIKTGGRATKLMNHFGYFIHHDLGCYYHITNVVDLNCFPQLSDLA